MADDGPTFVLVRPPGGEQIDAVGDGTLTEPGRHDLFCSVPVGADPDEFMAAAASSGGPPDVDGGAPHFVHGMVGDVVVIG